MSLDKITNPAAKEAIEALQAKGKNKWQSLFTVDTKMTDEGKTHQLDTGQAQ